jgi:hypothetical protein
VYDQVLFGLTSAISLIATVVIIAWLPKSGRPQRALWAISFAILCVVTAGVAVYGLGFLSQPFVNPVSSLISGFLAAGLLWAWKRRVGLYYLPYTIIAFLVLLSATLLANAPPVVFAVFIHAPSGLVIFLLPLYVVFARKAKWSGIMVGLGGLLIGVGGLALAALTAGVPILPADLVINLLAPIFFVMTLLFALGILTTPSWGVVAATPASNP